MAWWLNLEVLRWNMCLLRLLLILLDNYMVLGWLKHWWHAWDLWCLLTSSNLVVGVKVHGMQHDMLGQEIPPPLPSLSNEAGVDGGWPRSHDIMSIAKPAMANDWASLACFVLCNLSAGRELVFPGILEYSQNKKTSKVKRKQRVTAPNRFSSGPIITVFNIRSETWSNQSKKQSYEDVFWCRLHMQPPNWPVFPGLFSCGKTQVSKHNEIIVSEPALWKLRVALTDGFQPHHPRLTMCRV